MRSGVSTPQPPSRAPFRHLAYLKSSLGGWSGTLPGTPCLALSEPPSDAAKMPPCSPVAADSSKTCRCPAPCTWRLPAARTPKRASAILTSRPARTAPGVVQIVTAEHLEGMADMPLNQRARGMQVPPNPVLARDTVNAVGIGVAAVVAESRAAAEDAAGLIEVEYAAAGWCRRRDRRARIELATGLGSTYGQCVLHQPPRRRRCRPCVCRSRPRRVAGHRQSAFGADGHRATRGAGRSRPTRRRPHPLGGGTVAVPVYVRRWHVCSDFPRTAYGS